MSEETRDKKLRNNSTFDIDWFDEHFWSFHLADLNDKGGKVKRFLNKKTIRLAKKNISSRVITHWQEVGLITDDRHEGKGWRKFSISEIVWLTIIIKLRKFGFQLKKIKHVKEYLELYNSENNLSKCPLLDFYISYGYATKMPVKLIVFDDGEALLKRQTAIDLAKQYGSIVDDFISIDINQILSKLFKGMDNETDYLDYSFSPIEKEIQRAVLFEDIHSLTLKLKGGDTYFLDKEFIVTSKQEMNFLMQKLQYADAITSKKGNKSIYKLIEKKKIKK